MPRVLKDFLLELRRLKPQAADAVWDWLDRNPTAILDMIEVLAKDETRRPPR